MTISNSHNMLLMFLPINILLGEQSAQDQAATDGAKATATIANLLPANGCSYPVTINGRDYAPNDGSLDVIHDLVPPGQAITARISYRLTGHTATVRCGFGRAEVPEIAFRVIFVIDDASPESSDTSAR
jgi:hypothetical protein